MALEIGVLLNKRYQIKGIIARYENTTLYRAFDRVLNIEVAVREDAMPASGLRLDLLREMEVLAALRHPNLMRIIDHFEVSEQGLYQVTDFLDGRRVFNPTVFPNGMSVREVVPIILSICDALYYMHNNQPPIIHGEVNLNTIYTSSGAQGFLLLPKWPFSSDADTTAVRSGRNKPILDIQTDLYDLGLVTLSLLTSRSTQELSGKASSNRLSEVFAERIPPLPEETRQVIARALQPDRNERFPNIEAFKAALLNAVIFMPGEPVPSPLPSRSTPIHSPLEKQGSPDSSEDAVPKTPPATQPMSTAPIRRRVPWGLLILVATAGFVLLFFAAVI